MSQQRAVLVVGSPKRNGSASQALAEAAAARLEAAGWSAQIARVAPEATDPAGREAQLDALTEADLVMLVFPVYVDSLPAPLLGLLEAWRDRRAVAGARRGPRIAAICQCGFPEARHCDVAVEVCRLFAIECGLEWAGHLAFGMGPSVAGRALEQSPLGRLVRSTTRR